jgi:hypothetical protein
MAEDVNIFDFGAEIIIDTNRSCYEVIEIVKKHEQPVSAKGVNNCAEHLSKGPIMNHERRTIG